MIFIDIYGFGALKLSRGKLILRIHIHTMVVFFLLVCLRRRVLKLEINPQMNLHCT